LKYVKEHEDEIKAGNPIDFYDSVTGKLLFRAPVGRSLEEFLAESRSHGWPSFRDEETNWEHVRCLKDGECVSETGTHLGHNLPDSKGNRYCINLVSVAGKPEN
jgi:peptide methionine sulfoxide reductase MsrB